MFWQGKSEDEQPKTEQQHKILLKLYDDLANKLICEYSGQVPIDPICKFQGQEVRGLLLGNKSTSIFSKSALEQQHEPIYRQSNFIEDCIAYRDLLIDILYQLHQKYLCYCSSF